MAYFLVKVSFRSQTMIGKFLRSLYVGRMTEYLSLDLGAIVEEFGLSRKV
jgi:hypothetical protein